MAKIDFMAKNESMIDRVVRAIIGIILVVLALPPRNPIVEPWNYVAGLIALCLFVTAATGSSVAYHLAGFSTLGKAKAARKATKARKKRR